MADVGHAGVVHDMTRRVLAVLFALTWLLFPGFGVVDLTVTWDPAWARVLEAGWGVFFTVLVGFAFIAVASFLQRAIGPTAQLCVTAVVLGVSAVFAGETGLLVFAAVLAAEVAIVCSPAVNAVRGDRSLVRIRAASVADGGRHRRRWTVAGLRVSHVPPEPARTRRCSEKLDEMRR